MASVSPPARPTVAGVRWRSADAAHEPLAQVLHALPAGAARDVCCEEWVSLLGLGMALTAVDWECPRFWATYARHAHLPAAAALHGLRLRDLHPPDAAVGLQTSAEFPQHFSDSYVPLIERALEHGQPVLAWRGWPAPAEREWGVIVAADGGRLLGYAPGCGEAPVALEGAAHQVYVVEERRPAEPAAAARFAAATRATAAQWDGAWTRLTREQTGRGAAEALRNTLLCGNCPQCRASISACAAPLLARLTIARADLASWLGMIAPHLEAREREAALRWRQVALESGAELRRAQELVRNDPAQAAAAVGRVEQLESGFIESIGAAR